MHFTVLFHYFVISTKYKVDNMLIESTIASIYVYPFATLDSKDVLKIVLLLIMFSYSITFMRMKKCSCLLV